MLEELVGTNSPLTTVAVAVAVSSLRLPCPE